MKQFKGRVVTPGEITAEAVVTKEGFNTLASLQMALQFGDKEVKCGDQSNKELYGKPLIGKALCLPQTIGSTTGGLVLYGAAAMVDGLVSRISAELSAPPKVLLASGSHCGLILDKCNAPIREDQMLVLDGLYEIDRKNFEGGN